LRKAVSLNLITAHIGKNTVTFDDMSMEFLEAVLKERKTPHPFQVEGFLELTGSLRIVL